MAAVAATPYVALPAPVDRRMRFGPFPSVHEALKFVAYAAAGALVIPWLGALAWLPILAGAFVLTVVQPGGEALDRQLWVRLVRWERALRPVEETMNPRVRTVSGDVARTTSGGEVTVLRCRGRPVAFLPPEELRRKFEQYRELLRSADAGIVLVAVGLPIDVRPWIPAAPAAERADAVAGRAYAEMVHLICRRRAQRRVYVLQWTLASDATGRLRLEERTGALRERLATLGVAPERLEGPALAAAVRRFGWNEPAREEAP